MSFSCTEKCTRCKGTGTISFRQPISGTPSTMSCSTCEGTGSITWEVQ